MILLSGHTLATAMKFMPESLSVNLEERKSTATMQIGPDAPDIAVGDWLRDETAGCGQGVVWRVKSVDMTYNTNTRLVTMEHIINTLRDAVLFGETTPADITGDPDATICTAEAAIEYILDRQDLWELASDFPYLSANAYKFNGDTLYAAIESVTGTLEDPCWWYDLSSIPFKLHITQISDAVTCEMREGRNIQTLKKTIDRSRMYTRFYPIGKDNLQLGGGGYISKNESTYGMVAKVETNQKYETAEELEAWAWTRLERHCFPTVTISIGGEDLSRQTGESLDALTLGRKCRVPLPEFGTTIVERIIRISASDKIKEPDRVTVTMGNELQDIASIINEVIEEQESGHGGGGRGGMKKAGEDHAWFVDTDDHVGMIAEAIIGRGADGVDWSRVASIIVDGYGIHQRVVRAEGYLVTLEARIDLDEEQLRAEFNNIAYSIRSELTLSAESLRIEFENADASIRSELQLSAASLRVEFSNTAASLRSEFEITASSLRSEFQDESASVRSLISQEAGRIDLVVTGTGSGATVNAANIALAINQSTGTGEVHIDADHVFINAGASNEKNVVTEIGGKCVLADVTADYISGKIATLPTLTGISATFSGTVAAAGLIGNGVYVKSGGTNIDISDPLKEVKIDGPTNNEYKLQYKKFSQSAWQDAGSFSRAVASWTLGWSGGTFTAKANPQNQSASTTITQGATTWEGNLATVPIYGADSDNPGYPYFTGRNVVVDASSIYSAASPASAVMGGVSGTGQNHECTITKGDGTTTTLVVDCSGIYTAARQGYTQGTFNLATVTVQPSTSDSVYVEVSSGGTNYYQAGAAVTVYDRGTGITVYDAGTAIEAYSKGAGATAYPGNGGEVYPITSTHRFVHDGTARHYDVNGNLIGNHNWYHKVSSGGDTVLYGVGTKTYGRGESFTYYPAIYYGSVTPVTNGRTVYPATNGRSITPISGSALMLAATTRFPAGTTYTDTYYTKS